MRTKRWCRRLALPAGLHKSNCGPALATWLAASSAPVQPIRPPAAPERVRCAATRPERRALLASEVAGMLAPTQPPPCGAAPRCPAACRPAGRRGAAVPRRAMAPQLRPALCHRRRRPLALPLGAASAQGGSDAHDARDGAAAAAAAQQPRRAGGSAAAQRSGAALVSHSPDCCLSPVPQRSAGVERGGCGLWSRGLHRRHLRRASQLAAARLRGALAV